MTQLNPYVLFNGNCREAMTFYKECIGGDLHVQTIGESAMAGNMPEAMHKSVMHSALTKDKLTLMASDMGDPETANKHGMISLLLNCNSEAEAHDVYAKLAVGGQAVHPLEKTFWGAVFGDLVDQFGVRWMLNFDENAAK